MGRKSKNGKRKLANNAGTRKSMRFHHTSTSIEGTSMRETDIPGYYYDEVRKNYFKILPNSMSSVPSLVTNETIRRKAEENRRLLSLKEENVGQPSSSSSDTKSTLPWLKKDTVFSVLNSMQCGRTTCNSYEGYFMKHMCKTLRRQGNGEAGIDMSNLSPAIIPIESVRRLELTKDCDKGVVIWNMHNSVLQYLNLITFNANTDNCGSKKLNVRLKNNSLAGKITHKITDLCWSPMSECDENNRSCVLYTTVCPIVHGVSYVFIYDLEAAGVEEATLFHFDLGKKTTWSVAWNRQFERFSVGIEKECHVIDLHTRFKWTYSTMNSNTLTQQFSPSNPHLLYTGTRSGKILLLDMRALDQSKPMLFDHKHPVVCLKFFKNENYLVASDFSGLIRKYDMRFMKPMTDYVGLANSHYQLPFYFDASEKFIYATGADGYCKIWDVDDGSLLKSLAPPLPMEPGCTLPVSHLSDRWGNSPGNFGLLMAMGEELFEYS